MSESFVITTTVERTLSELASYHRDQAAEIEPVLLTLDSRNFHWLELKLKGETTRIEAIREHPQPDREHQWQWPESFRVIHEKKGQHSERLVKRGQRGEGISTIEICGFVPHEFSISRMMRRKSFNYHSDNTYFSIHSVGQGFSVYLKSCKREPFLLE